ncbi:hypothetical protein FACS189449_09200 [Alphaproteobacteria bacterium]|nr:hypothetical protein FACS189449_09200 [Alphaproteobacteria bacterium]
MYVRTTKPLPVASDVVHSFITSNGTDGLKNCPDATSISAPLVTKIVKTLKYAEKYLYTPHRTSGFPTEYSELDKKLSDYVFLSQDVLGGYAKVNIINIVLKYLKEVQPLLEFVATQASAAAAVIVGNGRSSSSSSSSSAAAVAATNPMQPSALSTNEEPYDVTFRYDGLHGSPDAIKLIGGLANWNAKQTPVREIKTLLKCVKLLGDYSGYFGNPDIECYGALGHVGSYVITHPNWENTPTEKEEVIHWLKMAEPALAKLTILPL